VSVIIDSLKKQNAFLQGEVERFANAVDNLSMRLDAALKQLQAYEAPEADIDTSAMTPAEGEALN
jgi:hypothetical protein